MFRHILTVIVQNQFVRQLFGAVAGAFIALVLYTAYRGVHDAVRAHLIASPSVPQGQVVPLVVEPL